MLGILKRTLGEEMVYRHKSGGVVTIKAVWNKEHLFVDPDTEAVVSSTNPNIGVQLSDLLKAPAENDTVDFLNDSYRVIDFEQDGQGAAQIILLKLD